MAALTKDTARRMTVEAMRTLFMPVAASAVIYQGSAVADNGAGYARALVAGDEFWGFALLGVTGTSVAGAVDVELALEGFLHGVAVTGASNQDDHGKLVYLSSDNDLTLTSTSNSIVGKVSRHEGSALFTVHFKSWLLSDTRA